MYHNYDIIKALSKQSLYVCEEQEHSQKENIKHQTGKTLSKRKCKKLDRKTLSKRKYRTNCQTEKHFKTKI